MKLNLIFIWTLFYCHISFSEVPTNIDFIQVAEADSPVAIVSSGDGSGRMFIVEKSGIIKILDDGIVLKEPFLDISSQVSTQNEQGLLGLAFSPDYSVNGYFYIYFSFTDDVSPFFQAPMRLARFTVSDDPDVANINSLSIITDISQNSSDHNGGNIAFGPDEHLYIGTGDDNSLNTSQNNADVNGKILRIDVSENLIFKNEFGNDLACGSPQNYLIPDDNPFFNDVDACQSVFLLGLRNPWRWSFDRLSGNLFIGDVGGFDQEEVSEIQIPSDAGGNLGWPCIEGEIILRPDCVNSINHLIQPFFTYERVSGQSQSVVGGYVYRGSQISGLYGIYLFNDIYREEFYFSELINNQWQTELGSQQAGSIVSYGEDEEGELYLVSFSGPIYKMVTD